MLELTKKLPTEKIVLRVVCDKARFSKIKATLKAFNCLIKREVEPPAQFEARPAELRGKEWLSLEEVFLENKPGQAVRAYRYREDLTQKQLAEKRGSAWLTSPTWNTVAGRSARKWPNDWPRF